MNIEKSKKRQFKLKPLQAYVNLQHAKRLAQEKKAKKVQRANNYDTKILLEETSDDDEASDVPVVVRASLTEE